MKMHSQKALAIVNTLIFMIIFTILSGILMTITSSNTRLMEAHIRRTKAYYASEAALVYAFDYYRRNPGVVVPFNVIVPWSTAPNGNTVATKTVTVGVGAPNASLSNARPVGARTDFTHNW